MIDDSKAEMTSAVPPIIVALHLPQYSDCNWDIHRLEEYVVQNASVFANAKIPAIILQDQTKEPQLARPETIAIMTRLGLLLRHEFPDIELGIILQAHDAEASLAVAYATGASFVRLKVYVGGMQTAEGYKEALGLTAKNYKNRLNLNLRIFADIHDRTGVPLPHVPMETAAKWAVNYDAGALILTGSTFSQSLDYIDVVRRSGVKQPLYIGGDITPDNLREALDVADGVIVSSSLMVSNPTTHVKWDPHRCQALMQQFYDQVLS